MSKGQQALQRVCNRFPLNHTDSLIIAIDKELKALEIIKNKYMKIRFNDEEMFIEFTDPEKHYTYLYFSENEKEQYELLKEVLRDE